jgi:Ni,Fe-hydrogenase maturation factor
MKIYIAGNPLVKNDRLPLEILPELEKAFPKESFEVVDPNENFIPEEGSVIVDTVDGISDVQWFTDINAFVTTKSVSAHDYDLGFHLMLLKKLHKISKVRVLGIPQQGEYQKIREQVMRALQEYNPTA